MGLVQKQLQTKKNEFHTKFDMNDFFFSLYSMFCDIWTSQVWMNLSNKLLKKQSILRISWNAKQRAWDFSRVSGENLGFQCMIEIQNFWEILKTQLNSRAFC